MTDAQKPRTRGNIEKTFSNILEGRLYGEKECAPLAAAFFDAVRASVLAELAVQEPFLFIHHLWTKEHLHEGGLDVSTSSKRSDYYDMPLYAQPMPPADQTAEISGYKATIDALLEAIEAPQPMDAHLDPSVPDPVDYAREMTARRKELEAKAQAQAAEVERLTNALNDALSVLENQKNSDKDAANQSADIIRAALNAPQPETREGGK